MLLTQQHAIPVMCQFAKCAQGPWQCLPFQPSEIGDTSINSIRPMPQHPDLLRNAQQLYLRKVCNMNEPTLWAGWHGYVAYATRHQ